MIRVGLRSRGNYFLAGGSRDSNVQEDCIDLDAVGTKQVDCSGPRGSFKHLEPCHPQHLRDCLPKRIFIFDNQDGRLLRGRCLAGAVNGDGGCANLRFGTRQQYLERSALAWFARKMNSAAEIPNNPMDHCESEATAC